MSKPEELLPNLLKLASSSSSGESVAQSNAHRLLSSFSAPSNQKSLNIEGLEALLRRATRQCVPKVDGGSVGSSPSHSNSPQQPQQQTAIVALQASSKSESGATATAILPTEDLQHLMNQSTKGLKNGEQNQFYLLVPSDVPVVVPSSTAAQGNSSLQLRQQQVQQQRRASVIGTEQSVADEFMNETRNMRRRVSHNEVERRRRDRINTWIGELQKLLPPDEQERSHYQSKGLVLKRVWEHFQKVDQLLKVTTTALQQAQKENHQLRQRVAQLEHPTTSPAFNSTTNSTTANDCSTSNNNF
ncbi:hypothetical protein Ciccas_007336 [Cichlidogyrus casuarinus]|uniref:BHLH domain-containing protein n=1 Tax=Cichlidogyrus casuarinus TaxID=1844966 RepID=A0ABD2Q364_9PLAT